MPHTTLTASAFALAVALTSASATAQTDRDRGDEANSTTQTYRIPGSRNLIKTFERRGQLLSAISRDGGDHWQEQQVPDPVLHLRLGDFDPLTPPAFADALRERRSNTLFIVTCKTQIVREFRAALRGAGAEIHDYLPSQSYLLRVKRSRCAAIRALTFVHSLVPYHPVHKLERVIAETLTSASVGEVNETRRYGSP